MICEMCFVLGRHIALRRTELARVTADYARRVGDPSLKTKVSIAREALATARGELGRHARADHGRVA